MAIKCDELVILLNSGISQRTMYFADHPKVKAIAENFITKLQHYLKHGNEEAFFIGVAEGRLIHDGHFLVGPTIAGSRIIATAQMLHSGGFLFKKGVTTSDVRRFFSLAAELTDPVESLDNASRLLAKHGIDTIDISPPYEDEAWYGQFAFDGTENWAGNGLNDEELESLVPVYQSLFDSVEEAHGTVNQSGDLNIDSTRNISERLLNATRGNFMDIMQLVRYPDYDSYTVGHSVRVAMFLVQLGHRLGMEQDYLQELGTAGLLHDVGKARIPDEILFKPDQLDAEERRIIETHPVLGAQILLENKDSSPLAVVAAWGHHLRPDGTGYPAVEPWYATDPVTPLLHVCDVFEALTAVRPYKKAVTPRRAYEIMLGAPNGFDPAALATFIGAIGIYPPGNQVQLTNGERGIVVEAGKDLARPRVRITHDLTGEELTVTVAPILDLGLPEADGIAIQALVPGEAEDSDDRPPPRPELLDSADIRAELTF
ncbi:MAG: HD domain-containing phosphohydrolase [bacterium]